MLEKYLSFKPLALTRPFEMAENLQLTNPADWGDSSAVSVADNTLPYYAVKTNELSSCSCSPNVKNLLTWGSPGTALKSHQLNSDHETLKQVLPFTDVNTLCQLIPWMSYSASLRQTRNWTNAVRRPSTLKQFSVKIKCCQRTYKQTNMNLIWYPQ